MEDYYHIYAYAAYSGHRMENEPDETKMRDS